MAASYEITSQEPAPWVLSGGEVLDAEIIGVTTSPNRVYFKVPMSKAGWLADGADVAVSGIAESIEALFASGAVVGAAFAEEPDASGLLAYFMDFVIGLPPDPAGLKGSMTGVARVPIGAVGDPMIEADFFAPVRAALTSTAAL